MSETPKSLAHYSVIAPIGKGGMGEVVRARDEKLQRDVALKLLPIEFADDPERMARFASEARILAALQHPNIATIFGIEEAEGRTFLVMELVEGEDLDQRIKKGAIPVDESLAITAQIAAGLEEAHERGIVHRDLKPANVMLTPAGQVKILDFGLARAMLGETTGEEDISNSPTLTALTGAGVILGTAAYMSPEQARGQTVDRRADIWALGVIFFEMLAGKRLFRGDTISDTLAAVLREEPDYDELPGKLPPTATHLLTRCLDRDPKRRLRDAGEMRVAFERPGDLAPAEPPVDVYAGPPVRSRYWVTAMILAILAAAAVTWVFKPTTKTHLRKLELGLSQGAVLDTERAGLAISPDGHTIAYVDQGRLWIRRLDQATPLEIPDSEGAGLPFWSPDGVWLGYFTDRTIWKIPARGGQRTRVGEAPNVMGAAAGVAWQSDGMIYMTTGNEGLHAIPAAGGKSVEVAKIDPATEQDFHDAAPLPDGRGVLYVIHRLDDGISALGVWDGQSTRMVLHLAGEFVKNPAYSPTGHILYAAGDENTSIWAVAFDLDNLVVTGEPFVVAAQADVPRVANNGTLVYFSGGAVRRDHEAILMNRQGEVVKTFGQAPNIWPFPALTSSGKEAVVIARHASRWDLWLMDERGAQNRLTDTPTEADCPVVSADGTQVYFGQGTSANWSIARQSTDGTGVPEILALDAAPPHYYGANPWISPEHDLMLYSSDGGETGNDIASLSLDADGAAPEVIIATPANELAATLSPDRTHVAYISDVTGRYEVYLARYPSGSGRRQVSVEGGLWPHWKGDGTELYYLSADSLTVVDVELGDRTLIGPPRRLFNAHPTIHGLGTGYSKGFDVTADGEHFLITRSVEAEQEGGDDTRIIHVENWFQEFE